MLGLLLSLSLSASGPVVAVHYFENRTPNREWDVFCKGLSDMLVTDLVQVPGVTVVERDKLEGVIGELKLQQSQWFDPTSAVKLGKMLGAGLIVTGQFLAFEPTLVVEGRVLDVKTGKVVAAVRVSGSGDDFFALEQELASKLARWLVPGVEVEASAPRTLGTALAYAQALDAKDHGDAKEASRRMSEVIRAAPDFQLGKQRQAELVEFLTRTTSAHDAEVARVRGELVAKLRRILGDPQQGADRHFCALVLFGELALKSLFDAVGEKPSLTGITALERRHHQATLEAVAEVAQATAVIYRTVRGANFSWAPELCGGAASLWMSEEAPNLAALGLARPRGIALSPTLVGGAYIRLLAFGELPPWSQTQGKVFPTVAALGAPGQKPEQVRKEVDVALAQYKEDLARPAARIDPSRASASWTDLAGQVDVLFGRPDAAIQKWQTFLTDYPRAEQWSVIKERLEALLGTSVKSKAFSKALPSCGKELDEALAYEIQRVGWAEGLRGLERLMAKVEKSCGNDPKTSTVMKTLYKRITLEAIVWNECGLVAKAEKKLEALEPDVVHKLTREFCED